jgi:nucleotide-binding universal stress UspA family protein
MQRFRNILFAADFSENSKAAFRVACALAVEPEASLIVIHVVEPDWVPDEPVYFGQATVQFRFGERDEAFHESLRQKLRQTYAPDRPINVEYRTAEGDANAEILRAAGEAASDLIVMGTHGRRGVSRLLAGSVAIAVLRGAHCPVIALRSHERPSEAHDIRVILHATDFSLESEAALQVARSLARDLGARLVIVHVAPIVILADGTPVDTDPRVYQRALDVLRKRFDGTDLRYPVETRIGWGVATEGIIKTAEEVGSDLVVIGTHGRTGLSRALMGSVAESVLLKAGCPILVVKPSQPIGAETAKRTENKTVTVF